MRLVSILVLALFIQGNTGNVTTIAPIITEPKLIVIESHGKLMVEINDITGKVIYGKDFTLEETSKVFWEALAHRMMSCKEEVK